ncbi:gamma-butyrobetaine hydroxylase-like domain-containing protein [Acuticoccus sp. I52.16.1]|uniref:gamma-butyrobetaine hydroxylase-like domain-containing protein n=1 Tax=Acuticoccus sp. I52.16.1 TaxID=2928472 RepID=UPI001FD545C7|nr:DUF971 domain-containing protein [Acuticoccus sp. I52.16.1]UOM33259.1 DUF971 domain-containing protein [Acuticoccus sp. I52.16.1]
MQHIPWPTRLTVDPARTTLTVAYDDGTRHAVGAELLRVLTPSAERTGHGARQVIGGKKGVTIRSIEPVGRYAVRIGFDDGHDSGLYTFETLHRLGAGADSLFAEYEAELAAVALTRDRPGSAPAPR